VVFEEEVDFSKFSLILDDIEPVIIRKGDGGALSSLVFRSLSNGLRIRNVI
jgi:hypothetical protein